MVNYSRCENNRELCPVVHAFTIHPGTEPKRVMVKKDELKLSLSKQSFSMSNWSNDFDRRFSGLFGTGGEDLVKAYISELLESARDDARKEAIDRIKEEVVIWMKDTEAFPSVKKAGLQGLIDGESLIGFLKSLKSKEEKV